MNIALLCPGPSLSLYPGKDGFDLVFGINRAATAHPVDVWAAGDIPLVEEIHTKVIGSPLMFTSENTRVEMEKRGYSWRGALRVFDALNDFAPRCSQWELFTATAALVYAAFCGATKIVAYGADWNGTKDFDGVEAGQNRRPERWALEKEIWCDILCPWLKGRGVEVERATQ